MRELERENSELKQAKGEFTYNLGRPKREAVIGVDVVHGYKEEPQVSMIEGSITDSSDLDLKALVDTTDATITLELANEKVISLRQAWFAADGNVSTSEGEIEVRFEGLSAEEIS